MQASLNSEDDISFLKWFSKKKNWDRIRYHGGVSTLCWSVTPAKSSKSSIEDFNDAIEEKKWWTLYSKLENISVLLDSMTYFIYPKGNKFVS